MFVDIWLPSHCSWLFKISSSNLLFFFWFRPNFLSINRFERKKNIELAISAFAMLRTLIGDSLQHQDISNASLTVVGELLLLLALYFQG